MKNKVDPFTSTAGWNFDNSYTRLPESFYVRLGPVPVSKPEMVVFNQALSESLGLNSSFLEGRSGVAFFSGNQIPEGAEPIAQAYAGHQFGYFTILGDGRAILLGEHLTPKGQRYDIQLKGSGQTPFSRGGDGRAGLGPMLREYIISEAMHALGIPTTRSLAVVTSGERVFRETALPGAILTRVAASHIRVGTFEYVARQGNRQDLQTLADYVLHRHYPDLQAADNPYLALLQAIIERQAALVAKWQLVGFIHGVMNTDNVTLSGETIDYGPCAFMDVYNPATVFSAIDRQGRYAYANQPSIAHWNLARFTEALLPLLHANPEKSLDLGKAAIATFPDCFKRHRLSGMRAKLGLFDEEADDVLLVESLLALMHESKADYTYTFRSLSSETLPDELFFQSPAFINWHALWQSRLARQLKTPDTVQSAMRASNPAVIPRNYRVEEALKAATDHNDFQALQRLLNALKRPYDNLPENEDYQRPPEPGGETYQTFCGT